MDIAALNTKIIFQKAIHTEDSVGNDCVGYVDYFSCFSTVSGTSGDELVDGDISAVDTLQFSVRYCMALESVTPVDYRILFRGRPCNILHIDLMGYKKKSLKVKAKLEVY